MTPLEQTLLGALLKWRAFMKDNYREEEISWWNETEAACILGLTAESNESAAASDLNDEPTVDDSVKCCPDCERPNQFGELCESCRQDREIEYDSFRDCAGGRSHGKR